MDSALRPGKAGPAAEAEAGAGDAPGTDELEIRLLLEALCQRYHYDFRHYAMASVKRRLMHAKDHFGVTTFSQLQDRLLHDPDILQRLLGYLTVQVSEMFRDPSFYLAFRAQVVPLLRTYPSLKFWIAGCSSGEEVYSFAILLREEGLLDRTMIYATDINPEALARAEAGVYPIDRIPLFTDNHRLSGGLSSLSDYYTAAYGSATFDKTLKRHVVFSDHSLVTDVAFAEMHVVSCRNVLIYFNRELQDRALGLFSDSLVHGGFLCLGSKESLRFSNQAERYLEMARDARIYRKLAA